MRGVIRIVFLNRYALVLLALDAQEITENGRNGDNGMFKALLQITLELVCIGLGSKIQEILDRPSFIETRTLCIVLINCGRRRQPRKWNFGFGVMRPNLTEYEFIFYGDPPPLVYLLVELIKVERVSNQRNNGRRRLQDHVKHLSSCVHYVIYAVRIHVPTRLLDG